MDKWNSTARKKLRYGKKKEKIRNKKNQKKEDTCPCDAKHILYLDHFCKLKYRKNIWLLRPKLILR